METAWNALLERDGGASALRTFQLKVRSLARSSATFGFEAVADTARKLEIFLASTAVDRESPQPEERVQVRQYLEDLKLSCVEFAVGGPAELLEVSALDLALGPERISRIVCLLSSDSQLSADLGFELGCFGFLVRRFAAIGDLLRYLEKTSPAAVLVDAEPFEQRVADAAEVAEVRQQRDRPIPLMILASRSDLDSRLRAVRAGGTAYFIKPLETRRLIEKLEVVSRDSSAEPYRILIVEEDYATGLDYCLTLQRTGMTTTLITEPFQVWQLLVDFKPDLILMNMSLTGVSGLHLAAVVRQQDAYANVPIVLLSSEKSLQTQVEAMRFEANDILTTPVPQDYLISAVSNHAQRARALNQFISTDNLTGLLSHTAFLERLDIELERILRNRHHMAYALIDIDHLQAINETFGHLGGDSVLRSLARLLEKRLRRTDLVARYGGDEFTVVLPETTGSNAVRVLGGICSLFSEIRHHSAETEFLPTFSCGVATIPGYEEAASLHQAARTALVSARRQGGNRVVLAVQ